MIPCFFAHFWHHEKEATEGMVVEILEEEVGWDGSVNERVRLT